VKKINRLPKNVFYVKFPNPNVQFPELFLLEQSENISGLEDYHKKF